MTDIVASFPRRIPWQKGGLSIIANGLFSRHAQAAAYDAGLTPHRVPSHIDPVYEDATKAGDAQAAYDVIKRTLNPKSVEKLAKQINGKAPIFVTPFVPVRNGGCNMMGVQLAHVLADCFNNARVAQDIYQVARVGRQAMDGLSRLVIQPRFEGRIEKDRNYVIVDDVHASGGTLATFAGYIAARGGNVISSYVMENAGKLENTPTRTPGYAAQTLMYSNAAVPARTLETIFRKVGPHVDNTLQRFCGFTASCLTAREAALVIQHGTGLKSALASRVP